jgi:endonuclease-3 related protein
VIQNTSNKKEKLLTVYKALYKYSGPQKWWPAKTRFEVIAGAILTQNTAWSNVEKAINNLRRSGLLLPEKIRQIDNRSLAARLRPAGYYNIKAKRLKNFVSFLYSQYGGSIDKLSSEDTDKLRRSLLNVNGIGPETCDSIMLYALNKKVFVVDAYTKRVFSRHGFFKESCDYHAVQKYFMNNLPKSERLYNEYHALIVRLAKEFCRTKPACDGCPLNKLKITCK